MERKYYTINESTARTAKTVNSFYEYKDGSATEIYKKECDEVYDIVDKIEKEKPNLLEKAERMAERYCRKLADYYNAYYRNEASCPSIMISGGGNFPVRKKQKQNSRRDSLMNEWNYLQDYAGKIRKLLTNEQPILSKDEDAIERLEDKLEKLKALQEEMKAANKAIRLKDTKKGDEKLREMGYSEEQIKQLRVPDFCGRVGYPAYALQNNNANIHRVEDRLKKLKATKEAGTTEASAADEEGNELFKVVKNTEIMRLQLIFDGKPDEEVRSILKSNGFRWSPKNSAWQRQLTDNALYSLKRVTEAIKEIA